MSRSSLRNTFRKVSHVIFDLDGTIIDTESLYTIATNNILAPYGKTLEWSVKVQLMGLPGNEAAQKIVELLELPITPKQYYEMSMEQYELVAQLYGKTLTKELRYKVMGTPSIMTSTIVVNDLKIPIPAKKFNEVFNRVAYSKLHSCALLPGAEALIRHLYEHKIPIAVATSSGQDSYQIKVEKYQELFSLFSHVVCGGSDPEVKNGKPAPDIFLICASRFQPKAKPKDCLVLEDAPNGVTAAIAADMQCIMVPDPHVDKKLTTHATITLRSLEHLDLTAFDLPPLKT